MEHIVGVIIGLAILGGLYYFIFRKKKQQPEQKEVKGFKDYQLKVANLTAKGMEENRDFVVAIISQSELQSKSPDEIEKWVGGKLNKEGILGNYDANLGLQEITFMSEGKTYDVFFLIVEETSQNVIDWKEPKPEQPKILEPYRFKPFNEVQQTEDSIIYEIVAPEGDIDLTQFVQDKIDNAPEGTFSAPTVYRFIGKFRTEGNPEQMTNQGEKAAIYFTNKKHFIVEGGEFFTTAPFTPYGGVIGKNRYSHRRHIKFDNCSDFRVRKMYVHGSNFTDGRLIGLTPENTPDFWYRTDYGTVENPADWQYILDESGNRIPVGKDNGAIRLGFPAYRADWEFEHAFDFKYCKNFVAEDLKAYAVWGDGICLGHGNENFIIRNSHISYVGRQGIAVYNCINGLFEHIYIDGRRAAIDFEPNTTTGYVIGMEVRNCDLRPMQTVIAALGNGKVDDIYIHHNNYFTSGTFIHCGDSREITRRKNWVVEDNQRAGGGHGSPGSGVKFDMVDNVVFRRNRESVGTTQNRLAARLNRCGGLIYVTDNDFLNASRVHVHNTLPDAIVVVENNLPEAENGMVEMRDSFAIKQGLDIMQPVVEITYDNHSL